MPADKQAGAGDRLDSWKEIAAYLGKGIRTVQRWERTEGLPVRRLGQDRTGPVFAFKAEIDEWWQLQSRRLSPERDAEIRPAARRMWPFWAGALLIAVVTAGLAVRALIPPASSFRRIPFTTEHGWELQPSISPDGRQIAYVWLRPKEPGFVYLKHIGGDSGHRLTSKASAERNPSWSPDGRLIAFVRRNSPYQIDGSIILAPASGGRESRIADVSTVGRLLWSRDGHWLVATDINAKRHSLIAISVSSGEKHKLTDAVEFPYCGFALSADLQRLVYCLGQPGASTVMEQALGPGLQPRGKPKVLIAKLFAREMVMTADLTEIIYTDGTEEEGIGLWRRKLAPDAKPEMIHVTSDRYATIAIAPDGSKVTFSVSRNYRVDTWKITLGDPSSAAPLLSTTHSDLNPDYSPDGRYIAFHSTRSGASDIWVASRSGADARRLTFTNARTTATPRWSPDGGWIAYESNQEGQSEVYVIRSNGGPARRLTTNPAIDAIPSWSRDGRWIYFCSNRTGRYEIWKLDPAGGEPVQVTKDGGFAAVESPDRKYFYYSQTRTHGPIWRIPLPNGEPEVVVPELRGLFFAVSTAGVYYQANRALMFWDAATRETREVFEPSKPMGIGMAVSPDGKELLFTQVELQETDLYLIDGLR